MKIIDISSHNGYIDFEKVKADGVEGVIIRAGYGVQEDNRLVENIEGCKSAGLPFGLYLYSYATSMDSAVAEVCFMREIIRKYDLYPEYPIYIDMEDADNYKLNKGKSLYKFPELYTSICQYFCRELEKAGFYVGVYASESVFQSVLGKEELQPYDKWVAKWSTVSPNTKGNIWQYTSDGKVEGISGRVDMNIAYVDFPILMRMYGLNGWKVEDSPTYEYTIKTKDDTLGNTLDSMGIEYDVKIID